MEQWKLSRQGIIRLGEYRHHLQPPGWNPDDTDTQIEGLSKSLNNRSRRPGIWYAYLLRTAYTVSRSDPAIIIIPSSLRRHSLISPTSLLHHSPLHLHEALRKQGCTTYRPHLRVYCAAHDLKDYFIFHFSIKIFKSETEFQILL